MAHTTSKKVICDTVVGPGSNEWYGTLVNTNIRYEDGSPVTIQDFLGVKFKSPPVTADITANVMLSPWQVVTPEITPEILDSEVTEVTAMLHLEHPHTFTASDTITWGINGNLTADPDTYTNSFELYADYLPSGTVKFECAVAPNQALVDSEQVVDLARGSQSTLFTIVPGETRSYEVVSGNYTVEAAQLTNSTETIVANAEALPGQVSVETGEETVIEVTYGAVQQYCAMDVTIGSLPSPIDEERLHVKVVERATGKAIAEFFMSGNRKVDLRRLPEEGSAEVSARITLNNVMYSAVQTTQLVNDLVNVTIDQSDIMRENVDISGFVDLPIKIDTSSLHVVRGANFNKPDGNVSIRLISTSADIIYTEIVDVDTDPSKLSVPVSPGQYTLNVTGFIADSVVYGVQAPIELNVANDGSTELRLRVLRGANLKVHGFPNYLSFGGLSDLVDLEGKDFIAAEASSIFKYAGNDGGGDPGLYLADDPATTKTIELANLVESKVNRSVLPVMISYTVNLSLGNTLCKLQCKTGLAHSFGNLILSLNLAQEKGKESVPAGYVVNPDFLGECQKGPSGTALSPDYSMPVREPLEEALKYRDIDVSIPNNITDTLKGYVQAVNWLIRAVAEKVTFGWQVNLWGVGNSEWIYSKDPSAEGPAEMAKKTAEYIQKLSVYSGDYSPDFLAVDRYEADDFTQRAYVNGYCYGPYEWGRFFDFCGALSLELQVPVMPWQIPASRIPLRTESVVNLEVEHWGSGGSYIFGDPGVSNDYKNIHRTILEIKPAAIVPHENVKDIFDSAQPFDLSYPAYPDFPLRGIFTVLLGGGATTGIASTIGTTASWTQEKLRAYMEDPIPFKRTSSS
ncbi:putative hydroxymethyltransferase [Hypoxylon sp. FL0890]|nr:putative hydroxymethyltransferase [Hypoxylon sp. FL0890]